MKVPRSILIILLLIPVVAVFPVPRLVPNPYLAETGRMREPLSIDRLIMAAIIASGTHPDEQPSMARRIRSFLDSSETAIDRDLPPAQAGEELLHYLHEEVFTVYDEFQTRVDVAMRNGTFNCVSSAVLYMILARNFDIEIRGVGTVDHAFCSVILPAGPVDVETTTVHGFNPGEKKEFQDAFGNITGYSYVPPSDYKGRNDLGERDLIGLILQNRISMLENQKRYAEAVELAVDRYALAPGDTTRTHMAREMVNYAALLNERHDYSEALSFLSSAVEQHGWQDEFQDIYEILYYNSAVALLQAGKAREALAGIAEAVQGGWMPDASAEQLRSQAAERILNQDLKGLSLDDSLALVKELHTEGLLATDRFTEYSIMFYSRIADEQAQKKRYIEASLVIEQAISDVGEDRRLVQAREAYRYNHTVEIHNSFAALFNSKRYEEASRIVSEALDLVPESDLLAQDLATVQKALSQNR